MKQKKIVLLTTGFPYGTGENFISAELEALPEDVELEIVPFMFRGTDEARTIPKEIAVINDCRVVQTKLNKIAYAVRGLMNRDFWAEIKKRDDVTRQSFLQILGFYARSLELYSKLKKRYVNELRNKSVTFYSYWLLEGAYAAALLQKKYNVKAYSRAHRVDVWDGMSAYGIVPSRNATLRTITSVFVCSQDGQIYLKSKNPQYADKFCVSYLGTQDYGWTPGDNREKEFVIVSCARIEPVKRVELLAEALKNIKDKKIHWVHFGDGSCRKKVEESIAELPGNIRVSLMGTTQHDDVMAYYCQNAVNLFVNTSSSEGLPVSIMEAISFGIPVIATDVGGTREIVNTDTGRLISADFSPEDLAAHISDYIKKDSATYCTDREMVRKFWENNFAAKANYDSFYREMM